MGHFQCLIPYMYHCLGYNSSCSKAGTYIIIIIMTNQYIFTIIYMLRPDIDIDISLLTPGFILCITGLTLTSCPSMTMRCSRCSTPVHTVVVLSAKKTPSLTLKKKLVFPTPGSPSSMILYSGVKIL